MSSPTRAIPAEVIGFEVEMMERIGRELGVEARFEQGPWDNLLQLLETYRVDSVVNGYEWTPARRGRISPRGPTTSISFN